MRKTIGLITLVLSLLMMLFYFRDLTGLVIANNPNILGTYYPIFSFLLFFISLFLLTTRDSSNGLENEVAHVWTAKGSRYAYHQSGKTQRIRKSGVTHEPQDAIVFIPDYDWVKKNAPPALLAANTFGENEAQYDQALLDYVQDKKGEKHVYIVDREGRRLNTNQDIAAAKEVFLDFRTGEHRDFSIPVSKKPRLGYSTFDMRTFKEDGREKREIHMGNKVTTISYKDGRVEK